VNLGDFLEGLGGGLVVSEAFAWIGRIARRIIPSAVRLWTKDPERREIYLDDWSRVIEDCPGNLWRLAVAIRFLAGGLLMWSARFASAILRRIRRGGRLRPSAEAAISNLSVGPPPAGVDLARLLEDMYGVPVTHVGAMAGVDLYRTSTGEAIAAMMDGACGTSYWHVFKEDRGQKPHLLIQVARSNATGEVRSVEVRPWRRRRIRSG